MLGPVLVFRQFSQSGWKSNLETFRMNVNERLTAVSGSFRLSWARNSPTDVAINFRDIKYNGMGVNERRCQD